MARGFDLTAEINLRGPSNIRTVVADIRRQLGTIQANVDVQINPATARNLDTLNRNFGDFNRTLATTRTSADAVSASLRNLAQAVQNTSTRSNQLPRNLQQINNATQNLARQNNNAAGATRDLTGSFEDFGRQSALAVRRFAAFATVTGVIYKISSAVTTAAKDFVDFDKELVRVAQVTDTSVKNLGSLVNQIAQLSTKFGVASKDLIQVSSTLAQAGLSARDTEKALRALALSALAPSFDSLNETVEGSIALMRQFGISAGDLEKALGSVNAVAAKFAVEASDLITAIQRTGGVFATASKGVSEGTDALNEFIAVFTSVRATTRESAETIATGLRTIFTRIQRGGTIEALKEYGVVLTDLEGKFVGPYEAVRRLSAGLNQLDPRDLKFSRIVEELGGFRQIGKVIPLIQQFATAQAALKVAQTGQDSLAKDTTIAQQALARQISKVKEEFIGLIRSIGQSDGFQTVVKLTLDLTSNLIRMADAAKDALPAIAAIMAFRGASALNQYAIGFVGGMRGRPARPQGANSGGYIRGYASGGYVPGVGNSDTVPAMLTPGEFVIRKKAVETIGAANLNRMNKYAGGGKVKRFANGGYSAAPMVDDIVTNSSGSVLPSRLAIEKIIQTGYGALDFDRTLKRTVGDSAYGKARTPAQKESVLSRYFRDPSARLSDATSAPLTQFGKSLLDHIKSGKVNPGNLSIVSKSKRVPGLAEHINELFGIPLANMIFTSGGAKEPAVEALRTKGPRANRVFKNFGGLIQQFKDGKRVKKIQTTDTNINNISYADAIGSSPGILSQEQVGVAILNPSATEPNQRFSKSFPINIGKVLKETGKKYADLISTSFGGRNKRSVMRVVEEGLDPSVYNQFSNAIDTGLMSGLNSAIASINIPGTRIPAVDDNNKRDFLAGINDAARGNLFEQILDTISSGGMFDRDSDPQRPFDFVSGLRNAAPFFSEAMRGIQYVDAKASEPTPENIAKKIGNQVLRDIGARAGRGQTSARSNALRQNSGTITDTILGQLRSRLENAGSSGVTLDNLKKDFPGIRAGDLESMGAVGKSGIYRLPPQKTMAIGGSISGEDTVPALLTPGEFVINKKAASRIGSSKLHQLNKADKVQGFNSGGAVGYVQKFANGGDVEARIQRQMMLFEGFLKNVTDVTYRNNRNAGVPPSQALVNARRVAGREFADASTVAIRNASSPERAMEMAEASSRVISQYMKQTENSAGTVAKSSSFTQKAFQAIQNSTTKVRGFFSRTQTAPPDPNNPNTPRSGFNLQNFGLSLAFIGPAIGDAIVNALGNDKVQNRGLSSAITGVTSGLAIGSQFGPYGALAGAAMGAASALDNFNKGVADAEIELSKLKIDQEADTFEKNIAKLVKQPQNTNLNQSILASLRKIGLEEDKNIANEALKRRPGAISNTLDSYFGANALERITFGFYKNNRLSTQQLTEQEASQNTMGSDIARKALTTKIESGLTFDQALSSFGASGQQAIRNNILEADKEYRQKLAELNEQAKTDPKIAINLSERQKLLSDKYFLLATEAERALSIDKQRMIASQKLSKTFELASVSISQTFENMNQALGRAKFEFGQSTQKSDDILNNRVSTRISFRSRDILNNPNAYSATERQGAVKQVSGMFGQDKQFVEAFYNFGENIENTIKRISVEAQKTGNNENISEKIVNELTRQMLPVFGDNRLTQSVREQLKEVINAQANDAQNGGAIDPQKLLDIEGFRQIIEYSKASYNTLKNQFETLEEIMNGYGQEVEKAAGIQKQVQDNLSNLQNNLISTSFRLKEIFGKDVDIDTRLGANRLDVATRFGLKPTDVDSQSLMMRRQLLIANRAEIDAKLKQATATQSLNVTGIARLQTGLAELDRQIQNVDGALANLPSAIEKNINDILGEIQRINSERENRIQAGAGFAEKLVGSTPDEIRDLNETYSVLNRTLNGNLVTINQSTAAQRAYFETLNRGGSPIEAMSAAQQAFANQTQQALGMFSELVQISGLKGQEVNNLRADLLENFARAQGLGLQNSPLFRQIITLLRQPPEEDKQIMKLESMLKRQQQELQTATNNLNKNLLQSQADLLRNANQGLILALKSLQTTFENAQNNNRANGIDRPGNQMPNQQPAQQPQQPRGRRRMVVDQDGFRWEEEQAPFQFGQKPANKSRGGIIYASSGGYLSQGSDTVPAMLSPGEFVVNSKASSKNLGLLKFMNEGGVVERTHEEWLEYYRQKEEAKIAKAMGASGTEPVTKEAQRDATIQVGLDTMAASQKAREKRVANIASGITSTNNARLAAQRQLVSENPEMTEQQTDTLEKSLNSVFARKTPGVEQNVEEVRLEIRKRNAQAKKDVAYREDVAKGTMTDRALEAYAESGITKALTATGEAGAGAVRTLVGGALGGATGLAGAAYKGLAGERSTTLDAVRDVSLDEMQRGINQTTGAGNTFGEVGFEALGAVSLNDESKQFFAGAAQVYKDARVQNQSSAAQITAKRASQAEQVFRGGAKMQGVTDFITDATAPSLIGSGVFGKAKTLSGQTSVSALTSGSIRTSDILDSTRPLVSQTAKQGSVPRTLKINVGRPSGGVSTQIDSTQFGSIDTSSLLGSMKPNAGSVATSVPTSPVIVKPQVASVTPKASSTKAVPGRSGKPRSVKEAIEGFTDDQLNDIAKKYGDRGGSTTKTPAAKKSSGISSFLNRDVNEVAASAVSTAGDILASTASLARRGGSGAKGLLGRGIKKYGILGGTTAGGFASTALPYLLEQRQANAESIRSSNLDEKRNKLPVMGIKKPKRKYLGGLIYASEGQLIPYEPKGTDTVPAMLTPGEFVINRQSTQKHLPLLKAINSNRLAKGGTVSPIYAQAGARIGSAGIGVGQAPSAQDKAIMLLAQISQGINQLNNNLPKEKTNTEPKPKDRLLGSPVDEKRRGLRGETPIQQAFREGRSIKEVKEDRKFAAAADRYEKRAAYETQKGMRAQAYEEKQIRGRIASGKTKKGDEERFDELQFSVRPTESKQKEISDSSFAGMSKADKEILKDNNSSYAITRRRQIDERYFPDSAFPKSSSATGSATVQQGAVATATSQIASPTAGMPNFDQIFGPLTTNVTQFSQALSSATPFLNQIASFASNSNFQSQQPGVSNNGGNASGGTLSLDGISQFTTKFEAFIGQLKGLNLPPVINVQGNHKVEVVFNGASTLENLATESIASLVRTEVSNAMNKLNRDLEGAIPNAGGQ